MATMHSCQVQVQATARNVHRAVRTACMPMASCVVCSSRSARQQCVCRGEASSRASTSAEHNSYTEAQALQLAPWGTLVLSVLAPAFSCDVVAAFDSAKDGEQQEEKDGQQGVQAWARVAQRVRQQTKERLILPV